MRLLFDHGSLVLVDPPDLDHQPLPGLVWDPRVGLWRAPGFRYAEVVTALSRRGLPFADEVRVSKPAPAPFRPFTLRPYQEAAVVAWELTGRSGMVILPTGAGKTRVAVAAMARTGRRTLCLVPTRALLHQWRAEVRCWYTGPVGCLGDGERNVQALTVSTFDSALRQMPAFGNHFDLLVVDEVHHFGAKAKDEALEMATAPFRLGLTATPPDDDALSLVQDLVGPTVYRRHVSDLAGRWLSEFDLVVVELTLDPRERRRYNDDYGTFQRAHRQFRRLQPSGSWQQFVAWSSESTERRAALRAWRRARQLLALTTAKARAVSRLLAQHHDSRTLIFTASNAAAYAIAREHLVMPITCEIQRREREQALAAFRSGELKTLVSARVLNEGIDVPDADLAIIVGGTFGEREHVQRVGRLLRPAPGKRAIVYELVSLHTAETRQAAERRRGLASAGALSA